MYKNIYQFQRELNLRECVWGGNVIPCETLSIFHTGKETFFQINWLSYPWIWSLWPYWIHVPEQLIMSLGLFSWGPGGSLPLRTSPGQTC